jgi:hypothetical protein
VFGKQNNTECQVVNPYRCFSVWWLPPPLPHPQLQKYLIANTTNTDIKSIKVVLGGVGFNATNDKLILDTDNHQHWYYPPRR